MERFNFSTHRICVRVYGVGSVCVFGGGSWLILKHNLLRQGLETKSLRTHLPHRSPRVSPWRRVGFFKKMFLYLATPWSSLPTGTLLECRGHAPQPSSPCLAAVAPPVGLPPLPLGSGHCCFRKAVAKSRQFS